MTATNNNLKHIFLMPCWGGKIKDHFEKTVLCPVQPATISPALPEKTREEFEAICGGKNIAVWGSMDGSNNRVFFNKMRPDDYILFSDNKEVKIIGQIALKTINSELSHILWPDGQRTFSLIYFIDRVVKVN